jgi:NADPH-dependent 2,4-dienoyl-CoA reductase/sulfur reductase-like enzyme
VAPDRVPLEKVMGPELGRFIRALHESHGVVFHLGRTAARIEREAVILDDGAALPADFVVVGIGVRPRTALAEAAGLEVDGGVIVDARLATSGEGIWAAGDIARWPYGPDNERIRVEHWVVAERHGQAAARSILGKLDRFNEVPFFWSQHYDVAIAYVGTGIGWDTARLDGDPSQRDCAVTFERAGRRLALATIFRDRESLEAEVAMERAIAAGRSTAGGAP